jgi:hypothetical protein
MATAAMLFTAPLRPDLNGGVECAAVNVGAKPHDVSITLFITAASPPIVDAGPFKCVALPPGGSCSLGHGPSLPEVGLRYCEITVDGKPGSVRGSLVSMTSGFEITAAVEAR